MARGSGIIVSAQPKGHFFEGMLKPGLTPVPGTVMQIDVSAGIDDNGQFTFELYDADADGGRPKGPLFVLLEDQKGGLATTAYKDLTSIDPNLGDHAFLYCPVMGDELNMIISDVAGTADIAAGTVMVVDDGTGELIDTATAGSPETEPFLLMETIVAPAADQLGHCLYTGY